MSFIAQITADISNFDNNIKKAVDITNSSVSKMQAQFDKLGDSFVNIGTKASILSAGLVAIGTKAFLMAADIEDAVGATEQIFKENANSVNAWAGNLDTSFGIAKKEALEYSNLMGSMLINIGKLTEQEASKQSAKLIELAGDLTAMYGGSTQDAVRALTGALKGNNTMLDNYGMAVNEALIKTKALELGLVGANGEMTLQAKQGATLALIWEQTGAAQGQAAREADGASGAMRALKTEITNLSTELGDVLLPVITPIVSGIKDFVSGIRDLSPEAKKTIVVVAGIAAAVGPLLLSLGGIIKILPLVMAGFTAITGPIGIAMTAIAGATILVIKNWDSIHRYFTSGAGADTFDAIIRDATKFKQDISTIFIEIKRTLESIWSDMGKALGNETESFLEVINRGFQNTLNLWRNLWIDFKKARASDGLVEEFTNIGTMFSNFGKGLLADVVEPVDKVGVVVKDLTQAQQDAMTAGNKWGLQVEDTKEKIEDTIDPIVDLKTEVEYLSPSITKLTVENLALSKSLAGIKATMGGESIGKWILGGTSVDLSGTDGALTADSVWNVDNDSLSTKMQDTADAVHLKTAQMNADLSDNFTNLGLMVSGALSGVFASIGDSLVNGDGILQSLGTSLLGGLGSILIQLGEMALQVGTGLLAVQLSLKSLNPFLAIAGGAALIAIGSAFASGSRKLSQSMSGGGGGGYSSAPSMQSSQPSLLGSDYRGAYQDDFKVEFSIGNDALVATLDTAQQRRKRI